MKRWPLIRHVRWWWLNYRVHRWAWECGRAGIGLGWPNEYDLKRLQAIWEGRE